MKRIILVLLALLAIGPIAFAGDNKKKPAGKEAKQATAFDSTKIQWLSFDELDAAMKKEPRMVFMDVYTDWCGWCKVMDKKTFSNPDLAKYVNKHFYAIKFNAERQDSVTYAGKKWGPVPGNKVNALAVELMQNRLSYPTTVIALENYQSPQAIPGYMDVPTFERILKYLGEGTYKTVTFDEHSKTFVPSWPVAQQPQAPAPH